MDLTKPAHTEEYYKALRDYKNSDHQIAFAYYSAWTGVGTNMQSSLMGLPDSVDLVSLWGGWKNPTEAQGPSPSTRKEGPEGYDLLPRP